MKLRTKIYLIFSILAITPLLILTSFSYIRYTQTVYQRMDDISLRLFENATESANQTLLSISQITGIFNFYYNDGSTVIQNLDLFTTPDKKPDVYEFYTASRNFNRACQTRLYADEKIYGIYIITPCGYVFSYSSEMNGSLRTDYNFESAAWYQDTIALDGKLYISIADTHEIFTGKNIRYILPSALKMCIPTKRWVFFW